MRFHAFQSLLMTGVYFVAIVAVALVGGILVGATGSGILGSLVGLLYFACIGLFLILMIVGCVKAYGNSSFANCL